jgi:hypothetical protein
VALPEVWRWIRQTKRKSTLLLTLSARIVIDLSNRRSDRTLVEEQLQCKVTMDMVEINLTPKNQKLRDNLIPNIQI